MNKQFLRFLKITFIILDILLLNIIFFSVHVILDDNIPQEFSSYYLEYLTMVNCFWLIIAGAVGLYAGKSILSFELFFKRTIKVYLIWIISIILYLFFTRDIILSRLFIILSISVFSMGLLLNRFIYVGIKTYFRGNKLLKRILIIGYNDTSKKLANYFEQEGFNTEILGFTESEVNVTELSNYPIMSDVHSSVEVAKRHEVDEIYSTITPEQDTRLYDLMQQADQECIRFRIVPDFSQFIKGPFHVSYLNDIPILMLRNESLDDFNNKFKKGLLI